MGGLLMVDWMVAVGPEAEDQRRRALVFILFCSVGYLTADLFSLTKSVISSLGRERRGWGGGGSLSQRGRAARLGIKLLIIQITKPPLTSSSWLIVFSGLYFREMEAVSRARRPPAPC